MSNSSLLDLRSLFLLSLKFSSFSFGFCCNFLEMLLISDSSNIRLLLSMSLQFFWFIFFLFLLYLLWFLSLWFNFFIIVFIIFLSLRNFIRSLSFEMFLRLLLLLFEFLFSLFDFFIFLLLSPSELLLSFGLLLFFLFLRFFFSLGLVFVLNLRNFVFTHLSQFLNGSFALLFDVIQWGLVFVIMSLSHVLIKSLKTQGWWSS